MDRGQPWGIGDLVWHSRTVTLVAVSASPDIAFEPPASAGKPAPTMRLSQIWIITLPGLCAREHTGRTDQGDRR
jgi:hypothetical protein